MILKPYKSQFENLYMLIQIHTYYKAHMHTAPQLSFKILSYHSLVDHNKLFLVAFVGTTMKPSDPLAMNPQPQCMSNHL